MNRTNIIRAAVLATLAFSAGASAADDGSLTWNGITLYGTYDIGVAYQNHGAPLSQDMGQGLQYMMNKNNNKSQTTIAPNGLSQSRIGVRGKEAVADGLDFVFNGEIGFNPQSGKLSDALKSLTNNNGVALANQKSMTDSSRAGQLFNGTLYGGLSSQDYGILTFGRQNTVGGDVIGKYDPMNGSYALSIIGYSGVAGAIGYTEDKVLDGSIKYSWKYDFFHLSALYQSGKNDTQPGEAWNFGAGLDLGQFSVDAAYDKKKDALSLASLSAAQLNPATGTPPPQNSLSATVADTSGWILAAAYTLEAWKFSGGFEHISYANPSNPLAAGFAGLGGYWVSFTNNTAFPNDKILKISWLGAKYFITKNFDATVAWYHYDQNSYGAKACSDISAGTCSGTEDVYSGRLDYRLSKRFDVYAGVNYEKVADGLANGYLYHSIYTPIVGFRFQF